MLGKPEIGGRFFYNEDLTGFNYYSCAAPGRRAGRDEATARIRAGRHLRRLDHDRHLSCPASRRTTTSTSAGATRWPASGSATRPASPPTTTCRTTWPWWRPAAAASRCSRPSSWNLYIGPLDFNPAGQAISLVDFVAPDYERFPRFREALRHAQVAELGPGDAIFIPSMWWHHVEALTPFNVLVNYWWRQSPDYMDTPTNALMLALLTMRELPAEQRRAWQEIFRHYIFEADDQTAAHMPPAARSAGAADEDGARACAPSC
jgi:hypothetical protein